MLETNMLETDKELFKKKLCPQYLASLVAYYAKI